MRIGLKMLIAAVLSLSIGVAFASPLLVSDLNIRPWIRTVQGPTADFIVEAVYANFTVLEGNKLEYQVVFNITNPSDISAELFHVNFAAAEKISSNEGTLFPTVGFNGSGGGGWEAEGAWVDGKWYNVTWTNGTYPYFDREGNMVPSPFNLPFQQKGYWMEGVQLYYRVANGTIMGIYMNMNGTWTDITGRTNVTIPETKGYSISNVVVYQMQVFQGMPVNVTVNVENVTGSQTKYTQTGEGYFNNHWVPSESRLIMLEGTIDKTAVPWKRTYDKALELLKSGIIALKTETFNNADHEYKLVNNTYEDTSSIATEIRQVPLAQIGNSYVYNNLLTDNETLEFDEWGVEVFVKPKSTLAQTASLIEMFNQTSAVDYHAPDIGCPWERILVYEKIENNVRGAVYLWLPTNMTAARIFVENMTK